MNELPSGKRIPYAHKLTTVGLPEILMSHLNQRRYGKKFPLNLMQYLFLPDSVLFFLSTLFVFDSGMNKTDTCCFLNLFSADEF